MILVVHALKPWRMLSEICLETGLAGLLSSVLFFNLFRVAMFCICCVLQSRYFALLRFFFTTISNYWWIHPVLSFFHGYLFVNFEWIDKTIKIRAPDFGKDFLQCLGMMSFHHYLLNLEESNFYVTPKRILIKYNHNSIDIKIQRRISSRTKCHGTKIWIKSIFGMKK